MEIVTKLEKESGIIARDPNKKLPADVKTPEQLQAYYFENANDFDLVDYEPRVEFLEANGYKVTRENLIDSSLSVKPPKKK